MKRFSKQAVLKAAEYLATDFIKNTRTQLAAGRKPMSFTMFAVQWKGTCETHKLPDEVNQHAWGKIVRAARIKVEINW